MISALLRAGRWIVGAAQALGELGKAVRGMRRGAEVLVDDTDPIPLTHKDAERIAEFGRNAGHEKPKSSSRYD